MDEQRRQSRLLVVFHLVRSVLPLLARPSLGRTTQAAKQVPRPFLLEVYKPLHPIHLHPKPKRRRSRKGLALVRSRRRPRRDSRLVRSLQRQPRLHLYLRLDSRSGNNQWPLPPLRRPTRSALGLLRTPTHFHKQYLIPELHPTVHLHLISPHHLHLLLPRLLVIRSRLVPVNLRRLQPMVI